MSFVVRGNAYGLFEKQVLAPDGVLDTFDLNYRPGQAGAILVVYQGVIQEPAGSYNLINGGAQINFSFVPDSGSNLFITYLGRELSVPAVIGNFPVHTTAIGDNLNTVFTLPVTPVEPALMVHVNGILQHNGSEWTLTGNQVTFTVAPALNDKIDFYIHGVERTDLLTVDDASITSAKLNLNYVPYTPAILTFGGMSRSSPVFAVNKFMPMGDYYRLRLMFSCTFGGTANDTIRFTLPPGFDNDGTGLAAGSCNISTATILETGVLRWAAVDSFDIKRPEGVNFTLGDEWTFEISMDVDLV